MWHKGSRVKVSRSKSMLETFKNIDINKHTTRTLRAGSKNERGSYILPFSYHPYHMKATQSYCEVIKLTRGRTVIVPHYVILQAYFARSQYVFQQLFKFGIDFESIYDPSKSYLAPDGDAFILLKKWTHDAASTEVARMAFDPVAQNAVKNMSQQFAAQQANSEPVRPKTSFPFEGRTTLKVFGKWCPLNSGKSSHQVFVVFDILSCSAQYPFNKLEYFRDNPGDKLKSLGSSKRKDNSSSNYQKPKPKVTSSLEVMPDQEPSNRLDELELEARQGTVFHDLTGKTIEKKRTQPHKDELDNQVSLKSEDVQSGNTGEGDSHGIVAPVDFQLVQNEYEDRFTFKYKICRLELFLSVLQKIRLSIDVESVTPIQAFSSLGQHSNIYSFFPTTYSKNGRASTWQFINYFKGSANYCSKKPIFRRALIARINLHSGDELILAEAERRVNRTADGWIEQDSTSVFLAITKKKQSNVSTYQISRLLEHSCLGRGVWTTSAEWLQAITYSVKHPSNTSIADGSYVDRQIGIIENKVGINLG